MEITFDWKFHNCDVIQNFNGLENVIRSVQWSYTATDGINIVSVDGSSTLADPEADQFVSFNTVTKTKLIEWVESGFTDKEETQKYLIDKLIEMAKPKTVRMPLPFN